MLNLCRWIHTFKLGIRVTALSTTDLHNYFLNIAIIWDRVWEEDRLPDGWVVDVGGDFVAGEESEDG